jgi:hypothetical protein
VSSCIFVGRPQATEVNDLLTTTDGTAQRADELIADLPARALSGKE